MMTFVLQNDCSPLNGARFGGYLDVVKTLYIYLHSEDTIYLHGHVDVVQT